MNLSRYCLSAFMLLWLSSMSAAAEVDYTVPVQVPDEFGLGERLALIDWLRERKVVIPDNAELPVLRRLYLTATAAAKPGDPQELQRKEEADRLRLQLWRNFSVNADPAASLEELQRQLVELQARRDAADGPARKPSQEERPAEQEPVVRKPTTPPPSTPPPSSPLQPSSPEKVVDLPPPKKLVTDPSDALFAKHAEGQSSLDLRDRHLLEGMLRLVKEGRFPVGGVWAPAQSERWSTLAPIIERMIDAWKSPSETVMLGMQFTLGGADASAEPAVALRRRLIERAVRSLAEPLPDLPTPSLRLQGERWSSVSQGLGLQSSRGMTAQHWLLVQDRQWARSLIPDLVTALERDLVAMPSLPEQGDVMTVAVWCAAMAPAELGPQVLALAQRIPNAAERLRFLAPCPEAEATALRLQTFSAIDDASIERPGVQSFRDPQVTEALVKRLLGKPDLAQPWIGRLSSLPVSPAACARMIELGLQAAPALNTGSPDSQAMWLLMAAQSPATRGCLSAGQRSALEAARIRATGPLGMSLNSVRICEEPDQQRRVGLIDEWLQAVAMIPGMEQEVLPSALVRGLWMEQLAPSQALRSVLEAKLMRHPGCRPYIERILARHGGPPIAPPATPQNRPSLPVSLATSFDPIGSPKQIEAYFSAKNRPTEYDVSAIAQALPAGVGEAWTRGVLQEFERWWETPTPEGRPHLASTARSIGLWAATTGSVEWSMIWARRTDALAPKGDVVQQGDGSLIYAVANPEHMRTRIWLEEQERIGSSQVPLIRWVMGDRAHPLPADITNVTEDWLQVLRQLLPKGRTGVDIIAPLLDVRRAFSQSDSEGFLWALLLSRLDS